MTMIQQVTQSFARRLVVEKAYQVLARFDEFGAVVASGEQKAFLDSVDVAELPELQGLLDIFDLVLVKGDGIGFMIVALVKQGRLKISQREALIEQAKACLKYTGKINHTKMPVQLHVIEFAEHEDPNKELLRRLTKRFPGRTKVSLRTWSANIRDRTIWTPHPLAALGFKGVFARALRNWDQTDEEMALEALKAGFRFSTLLVGTIAGLIFNFGSIWLFGNMGFVDGKLFGAIHLLGGILAVMLSIMLRAIRRKSTPQALLTAAAYIVCQYGTLLALGTPFSVGMCVNAAVLLLFSWQLGIISENA
ncbi:MAG: hypothetical protein KDC35_20690 [Acidobacteria bacterium]|nr:hypothetical protein [Acidobacteriota bacterium]